jgi:hypothetical protein
MKGAATHTGAPNTIFRPKSNVINEFDQVLDIEFKVYTCPTQIKRGKFPGATSGHPIAVEVRLPKKAIPMKR